jgi:peptide/nickel transport system substrate-binding protein
MRKALFALFLTTAAFILLSASHRAAAGAFDPEAFAGPKVRDLYLVIIRDPDAQLLALDRGKVDILGDLHRPVDVDALTKKPRRGLSIASGFHGFFLGFNVRTFPWNSLDLRRSAWQALPRERMVRDLFAGYAEPLSTFLPPVSPYFEPDVTAYPHDPEAARKRLADGGWTWGSDGVLVSPDGKKSPPETSLPHSVHGTHNGEIAVRMAGALSSIGIPVEAEPMDFSTMISRLDERDFQMYVLAWQMTRTRFPLRLLLLEDGHTGRYNMPGISDPPSTRFSTGSASPRTRRRPARPPRRPRSFSRPRSGGPRLQPVHHLRRVEAVEGNPGHRQGHGGQHWSLLAMEPASGP